MTEALEAIPFECFLGVAASVVALLLFLFRKHSLPWRFRARVTYVCDGDSIWVKTWYGRRVKLRLLGIDAPETEQAFGGMSQIILARMIEGRRIDVAAVDRDIYGRYVSALLCDGEDVCLRMIERGAAWPYFHYFNRMPRDVAQRYRMRLNWPEGIGSGFGRKRIPKLRGIGESAIAHGGRASSSGSSACWVSVE